MDKKMTKTYLMVAGTFLPAFAGIATLQMIRKNQKLDTTAIVVFAGLSVVGGYFTAKMLNKTNA